MKSSVMIRTNRSAELRLNRSPSLSKKTSHEPPTSSNSTERFIKPAKKGFDGKLAQEGSSTSGEPVTPDINLPHRSSASRSRLLANRSRTGTPTSVPDSPRSLDGRVRRLAASSPAKSRLQGGYDSDDSVRLDRVNHTGMKQDIMSIKTMLLKLRRILNESDTHNPFDSQSHLANGLFNSLCPTENVALNGEENMNEARLELADLRRQVLFLQGQLEDKEKTVQNLQEQMIKLATDNYQSNSAPASTVASDVQNTCNAATQTERIRPISAGPSLLNGSSIDGSAGSLVSVIESLPVGRPRPTPSPGPAKRTPSRLWRQPGEPPSPPRYSGATAIPRRARSGTRAPYSAATT